MNDSEQQPNDFCQPDLHKANVVLSYSEEEIRQMARDFFEKFFPKWEVNCPTCGACNCKNNDNCIVCNCQL